jgi:hypothetical protein
MSRRILLIALAVGATMLLAIQLIPYGRQHANPPVTAEPAWPDPAIRELAVRACFDCHSNQTIWPWTTNIAPVSWILQNHVEEGRSTLNFSEWDRPQPSLREDAEVIREGEMTPAYYRLMHRAANLSASETAQLVQGLGGLR